MAKPLTPSNVTVTYEMSEGRFGDQLMGYLHAKWISYHHGFKLLYKPFLYSDSFALHESEELWSEEKESSFDEVVTYSQEVVLSEPEKGSRLYVIPFFSDLPEDLQYHPYWAHFPIGWEDFGFRSLLRTQFSPRKSYLEVNLPKDHITVALHVRRGGNFDAPISYLLWPLRFAPDSYYIESLRKLTTFFPNRPLYAFIFTDDPAPHQLAAKYQTELQGLPITIGYRHGSHVMDDFFSMMHFDCLIRTASNFSLVPSLIAGYQVVMTPKHHTWWIGDDLHVENYIDEIHIQRN